MLEALQKRDGKSRFDPTDAPLQIVHGKNDETVTFDKAETLKAHYDASGVPYTFYPLNAGHGAWGAKIDGKPLTQSAFDFVVTHLKLDIVN